MKMKMKMKIKRMRMRSWRAAQAVQRMTGD
jgi:hypothetical protein